jgi:hypothetical protein
MKLHTETIHDPSGLPAYRLYEFGPFSLTTWPGKNNRDARPGVRQFKGTTKEIGRRTAAVMLATIRALHQYAP